MLYEELEITWIAATIFFGFGQAVVAIILSFTPRHVDDVITYFEWLIKPLNAVVGIGFFSLLFAIVMSWRYFCISCSHFSTTQLVICSVVTVLGFTSYFTLRMLVRRTIFAKLRPATEDDLELTS